jgi:hypothetical protein
MNMDVKEMEICNCLKRQNVGLEWGEGGMLKKWQMFKKQRTVEQ